MARHDTIEIYYFRNIYQALINMPLSLIMECARPGLHLGFRKA